MTQILQAENVTLRELIDVYGLQFVGDRTFFKEWQEELPDLSELEMQLLDQIKAGYLNLRNDPPLLENTVNVAIVSPLLFIGQFYLPPFHLKLEKSIELTIPDQDVVIRGRIDFLLLKRQLWITVIESKQVAYSVEAGLDQILAYMLAAPQPQHTVYGLITSGGSFMFLKLLQGDVPQYGTSNIFDIRNTGNQLYDVLRILKRLAQLTG
jgi:hypothetical protein